MPSLFSFKKWKEKSGENCRSNSSHFPSPAYAAPSHLLSSSISILPRIFFLYPRLCFISPHQHHKSSLLPSLICSMDPLALQFISCFQAREFYFLWKYFFFLGYLSKIKVSNKRKNVFLFNFFLWSFSLPRFPRSKQDHSNPDSHHTLGTFYRRLLLVSEDETGVIFHFSNFLR